jgi:DNA polymerase/3'-5' exonuclease PolX
MLIAPRHHDIITEQPKEWVKQKEGQIPLADAVKLCAEFHGEYGIPSFIVGSMRRARPYVGDIDLLTHDSDNLERIDLYTNLEVLVSGPEKISFMYKSFQIDLNVCSDSNIWGASLLHHSGSKRFNIVCRNRAISLGMKLNQHGLFKDGILMQESESEEAVLRVLGLLHHLDPSNRMG